MSWEQNDFLKIRVKFALKTWFQIESDCMYLGSKGLFSSFKACF
jgi:hypothetical protein